MMRRVTKIDENLFAYLYQNNYQIHIISHNVNEFIIKSQEPIIYYTTLNSLKKSFMYKNSVVNHCYLLMVDRKWTWSVFRVKNNKQQPEQIYTGTLMSELYQLNRIIGVQEIHNKVVVVFDHFNLLYLLFPEQDQPNHNIFCKQFIPYGENPQYQHSLFATTSYLPNPAEEEPTFCRFYNISEQQGVLLIAYKSNTNSLSSIYAVKYDCVNKYFLSGRNVLNNIEHRIIDIYPTSIQAHLMVQTQQEVILWKISSKSSQQSFFNKYAIKTKSHLSAVYKDGSIQGFIGVKANDKIILLSMNRKTCKLEEQTLKINTDMDIIEVYGNLQKEQYYCLTNKEHFYSISNNNSNKIVYNDYTSILHSKLYLHPNYNFIIIHKSRGQQTEKVIFGNHIFAYEVEHYLHGLILSNCTLIHSEVSSKGLSAYVSSPLIGTQKMNINLIQSKAKSKGQSKYELSIEPNKPSKDQSLFLNSKYQITGQCASQIGKKEVRVQKMFEQAAEYVTGATVLSELIVLSLYDQIHIFDSKFNRKYIYCCNSQIKSIFALNDINLLGVELFEQNSNANELMVLILELDKARKMKNIIIPQLYGYIQLSTLINTAQFKLNLFSNKLIICSNDPLHRFQLEKIQVAQYQLPLPTSLYPTFSILPLLTFTNEKNTTDFLLIFRDQSTSQQQHDQVQIYFGFFTPKYLFKKMDFSNITLSYERILTLSTLPRDNTLFAIMQQYQEGLSKNSSIYRNLLICGQRYISMCSMKVGRVQFQWLQNQQYLHKELTKMECISKQNIESCNSLQIEKPVRIVGTAKREFFIVYNSRQIYYTRCRCSKAQQISYYSLINDDFTQFRNNISVGEIQDEQFMHLFNKKMVIKDVKYLNDSAIFVLYQSQIVVLEIGFNSSLIVKQELKFKSEADTVQIQQFLQNYDESSIYLRDMHQRIYVLKYAQGTYKIILHSNMDDDVLLFSRVNHWNQRQRIYCLGNKQGESKQYDQQLVLKKDSQLVVKNIASSNQDSKMIYL